MFICFHVSDYVHSMLDSFSRRHQKLSGTEWMATAQNWNKSLRRLKYCTRAVGQEDLVWCTKSQPHLCIFTSASVWSSPHSHSFTSDTVQLGLFLQNSAKALFSISSPQEKLKTMSGNGHWIRPIPFHTATKRVETYPMYDHPRSLAARCSFAPWQKSRQNHLSYLWKEALSGIVFVSAQGLTHIVRAKPRKILKMQTAQVRALIRLEIPRNSIITNFIQLRFSST